MLYIALLLPLLSATPGVTQRGLVNVTEQEIPAPLGTKFIPIEGGDLEGPQWHGGWSMTGTTLVKAPDAPQGKGYAHMEQKAGSAVFFPTLRILPGVQQYYLSFSLRLKTPSPFWSMIGMDGSERPQTFGSSFPGLPSTEGQWRRVGLYVWAPLQAERWRFAFRIDGATVAAGQFVDFNDVRLRTATSQELAEAYAAQRRHYPEYDARPRGGDGRNLALSIAKWKGRGLPGKPFVIWAVGSSWTNSQGDGYPLLLAIHERFPQAPTLIYKKRAGSGTPWDFARGWLRQYILADNPDLILTYTNGDPDKLDDMLASIRARSTADIIVPSLHYFRNTELSEKERDQGVVDWAKVRAICRKHGVEFVENRAELYDYLKRIGQPPAVMVGDPVHQNEHGYIRIWDNITRHVADPGTFSYDPQDRERSLTPDGKGGRDGEWFRREGDRVKIRFRGNRIDLAAVGPMRASHPRRCRGGYVSRVRDDLYSAGAKNTLILKGPGPGDVAPHEVELLSHVVPQTWTITMVDDAGGYELSGSVTGPDGRGHVLTVFTSRSGQVRVDPALWRHVDKDRKSGKVTYPNAKGDTFTFDVRSAVAAQIRIEPCGAAPEAICLARQLRNTWHELTLAGQGLKNILAVRIAEPPGQRQ